MHQYFALYINTLILHKCSQLHINAVFTILSYHRRPVRWHQNNWSVFLGFGRDWPEPRISCGVMIWNCVHTTSAFPSFSARENKREATWAHVVFNPLPQEKHFHISGPAESRVPLIKTASEGTFMWPHKVFVLIIKKNIFVRDYPLKCTLDSKYLTHHHLHGCDTHCLLCPMRKQQQWGGVSRTSRHHWAERTGIWWGAQAVSSVRYTVLTLTHRFPTT